MACLRSAILAVLLLLPAEGAQAGEQDFRLPTAVRERLVQCAAANFAFALVSADKTEHEDRIIKSASFSATLIDAGAGDQKSINDEVMRRASDFLDLRKTAPRRAAQYVDECDSILAIGVAYEAMPREIR